MIQKKARATKKILKKLKPGTSIVFFLSFYELFVIIKLIFKIIIFKRYLNINHAVMRESQAGRTSKNQPVNSPLNATVSFYNHVFKQMQDQMQFSRHLKGLSAELQSLISQKWFEKVKNSNVLPGKD